MGFFKFLKREKKSYTDELDLPPEPPPLEGFEDKQDFDLPEIKADDFDMLVNRSAISEHAQKPAVFDMSKFDADAGKDDYASYEPKMPEMKGRDIPDFPEFPEMEEEPKAPSEPQMQFQPLAAPKAAQPMPEAEEEATESGPQHMQRSRLFHHEKRQLERPARRKVYVRVDKFKAVLDGISMMKSSVRKSDESLMRLESIKNSKDRAFDKVKYSLEDLQKKLIFIDKTLFKGD